MADVELSLAARRLYEQVQHLELDSDAQPLAVLCAALTAPIDEVYDIAASTEHPWELVLDLDRCPAAWLPWLAQFNGVPADSLRGLPVSVQRETIRDAEGRRRGRPSAMRAVAQRHLTGARTVLIIERDEGARHFTVITRTSQTPDPDRVEAALRAQKPATLEMDYLVSDLQLWVEVDPAVTWAAVDPSITWADLSGTETIHA